MALAEARDAALTNRRAARAGGDPLAERRRERASAVTFEAVAREVFELKRTEWKNAKHTTQWIGSLEEFAFPRLAKRPVADIDANDVLEVLKPLLARTPTTAKRLRQRIAIVLAHAVSRGLRQDNPAQAIAPTLQSRSRGEQPHHRALPYGEVAAAIDVVRESSARPATKLALEFLILTASRSSEVRFATWSEIDVQTRTWTIPANRMKAEREHRVPLCERAMAILDEARAFGDGCGLIFPASSAADKALNDTAFVQLLTRLGIDGTAHGFRTSFRVWSAESTSTPREVGEGGTCPYCDEQSRGPIYADRSFRKAP